jgi:predicted nucleic acid-binding protein
MQGAQGKSSHAGAWDPHKEWPPHPARLLTPHVVFDTNVPYYLALANKSQMLRKVFSGRAHIPDRVRGEIAGLGTNEPLVKDLVLNPFAEIHRLTRDQAAAALGRQIAWHGPSAVEANPNIDRGEAEALALCDGTDWVVVSQDSNALSNARKKGIPIFSAPDVLLVIAAAGECLASSAWKIYGEMHNRHGMELCRFLDLSKESEDRFMAIAAELGCKP